MMCDLRYSEKFSICSIAGNAICQIMKFRRIWLIFWLIFKMSHFLNLPDVILSRDEYVLHTSQSTKSWIYEI